MSDVMVQLTMDDADTLTEKLGVLSANLAIIHGGGLRNFLEYSDETKGNFLWGCATLARECLELASRTTAATV